MGISVQISSVCGRYSDGNSTWAGDFGRRNGNNRAPGQVLLSGLLSLSKHKLTIKMTITRKLFHACVATCLLIATALATPAQAQQVKPLPPKDVFRFVIFDAGDALEIDWAVADGAYMYRDAFGFSTDALSIELGNAELPVGEVHTDEFLGEQVTYRGNFFVRIPYTFKGDSKPERFALTIESRGCLDSGFCYVPQTWVETVELKSTVSRKLDLSSLGGQAGSGSSGKNDFPPPDEVFFPDVFAVDGNTVEVGFRIIPGFYLYKEKISVRVIGDDARAGTLELPTGTVHTDEFFGEQEVYYDEVMGRLAIARATPDAMTLELELNYQGCADDGLCYVPQTKVMTVNLPEAVSVSDLSSLSSSNAPVSEQARLAQIITHSSIWVAAGVFSSRASDLRLHLVYYRWCRSCRASSPVKATTSPRCGALHWR